MVQSRRLTCLGGCLLDCLAAWVEGLFHLANRFAFVFVVRACVRADCTGGFVCFVYLIHVRLNH